MCAEVLADNWATRAVLDLRHIGKPALLRRLPSAGWRVLRAPMARFMVWLTVGMYPPVVRARLGYGWSRRSALALRLMGRLIALAWRLVPFERRFHPRARAA
ncbi:hypothetical protein DMB66_47360 [Actinoplanes sp. ATCC 53533]|nr:hypothetical protein DMB66_47360 [Actinoplanes sp. ATCC 53533]